jgi:hypothetical protein
LYPAYGEKSIDMHGILTPIPQVGDDELGIGSYNEPTLGRAIGLMVESAIDSFCLT